MEKHRMQQMLIDSAIRVVVRDGLVKATTKAIAREAGVNEVYIYRGFKDKEDLLRAALHLEDTRFIQLFLKTLPALQTPDGGWIDESWTLWRTMWEFILSLPEDCVFYARYYHSANFQKYAREQHLETCAPVVAQLTPAFREGINVPLLLGQVFETMLFFALQVLEGRLPHDEATARLAYRQIYSFIAPHIQPEKEKQQ